MSWSAALFFLLLGMAPQEIHQVNNDSSLQNALKSCVAGDEIVLQAGEYRGGIFAEGLRGETGKPIVIRGADPNSPPVITGGGAGIHLSDVAFLELRDLVVKGSSANGINVDDGGTKDTPSHHIELKRIVVRDVGPRGNRDGIKLSGVDDFRIEDCTLERWGSGGSGIDMVGCHRGEIVGCTFREADLSGANGVQAKGGSRHILIRGCRFVNAGQRAVNLGGSTGMDYFRPRPEGYEAKDLRVEDCTFIGSMTPVAFVGVDGAIVRQNTIYRPKRWGFRILQETRADGFVPCRNGEIVENLIVFRSDEMATPFNIGDGTAPESFKLVGNAWYCVDRPDRSRLRLPIEETGGVYGVRPEFEDEAEGNLILKGPEALQGVGARAEEGQN